MNTTTLVIPAYNEENRIGPVLHSYVKHFDDSVRFLVVMNGCTDDTRGVVEAVAAEYPDRVEFIEIVEAVGKGAAIVQGWKEAKTELVGFVDADGATPPTEFEKLIRALNGHDGVIASRFIGGSIIHSRESWLRTVMSHGFITFVRVLFWMPFRDTQCGAKIFRRKSIQPIIGSVRETGMIFDVELLWRLHRDGARVLELPTEWTDQPGSAALGTKKQFVGEAWRMLRSLMRLRLTKR